MVLGHQARGVLQQRGDVLREVPLLQAAVHTRTKCVISETSLHGPLRFAWFTERNLDLRAQADHEQEKIFSSPFGLQHIRTNQGTEFSGSITTSVVEPKLVPSLGNEDWRV